MCRLFKWLIVEWYLTFQNGFFTNCFLFVWCAGFHLSIHAGRTAWAVRASIDQLCFARHQKLFLQPICAEYYSCFNSHQGRFSMAVKSLNVERRGLIYQLWISQCWNQRFANSICWFYNVRLWPNAIFNRIMPLAHFIAVQCQQYLECHCSPNQS